MSMTVDRATIAARRSLMSAPGAILWLLLFTFLTAAEVKSTTAAETTPAAASTNSLRTETTEPRRISAISHRPEAKGEGGPTGRVQSSVQKVTESTLLTSLVAVVVAMLLLWAMAAMKIVQRRKGAVRNLRDRKSVV